ncbi:hypothetical protein Pse7367_2659 [Thalassoporum mexicanum PCC 7367]|nr:hypothetical protein Pse7367_2659 [Pseudanabaena sp. PCC 7367]
MGSKTFSAVFLTLVLGAIGSVSSAKAADFPEAGVFDFSDFVASPDQLILEGGVNTVSGDTGPSGTDQNDYFQFDLTNGEPPFTFILTSYTPGAGNTSTSFRLNRDDDNSQVGLIGTLSDATVGTDFFPAISSLLTANSVPLSDAIYHIDEGSGPASWRFTVQAVPFEFESGLGLLAFGGFGFGHYFLKKRKRKQKKLA